MDQTLLATNLVPEMLSPIHSHGILRNNFAASSNAMFFTRNNHSTQVAMNSRNKCSPLRTLNKGVLKASKSNNITTMKSNNVSFVSSGGTMIPNSQFYDERGKDELKPLWYSREELMDSCNEAKEIVKLIHLVGGKFEEIDHSRHCVVGLEKYHGKKEREKYRKLLIRSVLIRQEMNRGLGLGTNENECLSQISQMMSSTFKDFALWQAAMHEFHAYGNSLPANSLLLQQTLIQRHKVKLNGPSTCTGHTVSNSNCAVHINNHCGLQKLPGTTTADTTSVSLESRKGELLMIGSTPLPIIDANNPSISSNVRNTNLRLTRDFDQHAIVHKIQPLQCTLEHNQEQYRKKRPQEYLQDVKTIMDGYVERKRLRTEVGHLMGAAQLLGSTQMMGIQSILTP
jgi:hypothetical protein